MSTKDVEVVYVPTDAQLIQWYREGIEIAIKHLQNNRKTLAIDALIATLTRQTW